MKWAIEAVFAYELAACHTPLPTLSAMAATARRTRPGQIALAAVCTATAAVTLWHLWLDEPRRVIEVEPVKVPDTVPAEPVKEPAHTGQ